MMFHVKSYHPTWERTVYIYSVSWLRLCSGTASSHIRSGQSRPLCLESAPLQSCLLAPSTSYLHGSSPSPLFWGTQGLTDERTGSQVTTQFSYSALQHTFISKKCWLKYRPWLSLMEHQLQPLQFGKQMPYHCVLSEGYVVCTSRCCLAHHYKILHFSFTLFSAVFFFPWIY